MTAFADHTDLATWLGLDDMTSDENDRADQLLADASDIIRDEVKRGDLGLVTDEEITLNGTADETILLPSTPVIGVSSVTLNGDTLTDPTDWYLDGNMIVRSSGGFGSPADTLEVTYSHGYAEVPGKVKTICLQMVVRVWTNPGAAAREHYGDSFTAYDNTGMQLTDDERRSLKRLFGASVKSVTVGR